MPATPTDVALYTNDGIVVTSPTNPATSSAILAIDPTARDLGDAEIVTFFDDAADAQVLLDEKFAVLSQTSPIHELIEIEESLGLGRTIALLPAVPVFTVIDEERDINAPGRLRAYSYNMASGRYSVELLG